MITHGVVVVVRWWLLVLILLCYGGIVSISGNKLDDVYKELKHLNKPALKSIKSPDGDIIDCVHISHQPAFDHPLLKNHTIQHAIVVVQGEKYYGTKATMNVWKPIVQQSNEFSLSQLWIIAGSFPSDLNTIEAGWQRDAYQHTGCYNLRCPGFIQTSNKMALGGTISPISAYDASQYEINYLVWKDTTRGAWWLQFGNEVLGYWPTSLFSYLADSASQIEWGGEVINYASGGQHTTTQMGSGHFPEEGFGKAAYIKNIQSVDGSNNLRAPIGVSTVAEKSNCYNVQVGNDRDWGNYIYYGGPGRNPNCP